MYTNQEKYIALIAQNWPLLDDLHRAISARNIDKVTHEVIILQANILYFEDPAEQMWLLTKAASMVKKINRDLANTLRDTVEKIYQARQLHRAAIQQSKRPNASLISAAEKFERAHKIYPKLALPLAHAGNCYRRATMYDKAAECLEIAISSPYLNGMSYNYALCALIQCYQHTGQKKRVAELKKAAKLVIPGMKLVKT